VIYYVHDRPDGCCGGLRQNLIVNARGTTFSQLADVVFRAINHSAERYRRRRRRRFATETPSLPRGNGVHANVTTTDATAGPEFRFSLYYYYYYYYYHNGKRGLISRRYYNNNLIVRRHRRRFVARTYYYYHLAYCYNTIIVVQLVNRRLHCFRRYNNIYCVQMIRLIR